eukprot:7315651-Prymnesium_polylepis.1
MRLTQAPSLVESARAVALPCQGHCSTVPGQELYCDGLSLATMTCIATHAGRSGLLESGVVSTPSARIAIRTAWSAYESSY